MEAHPTPTGFTLFETALGYCGVAWRDERVARVALPQADIARARARVACGAMEAAPPAAVATAAHLIRALLDGEAVDLRGVEIDAGGASEFDRRVYAFAREVGPGETVTYGEIARNLGDPALARDVGAALGRNPTPLIVPCHRVVAADGRLGGFSAPGGPALKRRLLELEGAIATPAATLFTV